MFEVTGQHMAIDFHKRIEAYVVTNLDCVNTPTKP